MSSYTFDNLGTIGMNIRKCRKAKKLRQEDLAEMTGLSAKYIGVLERGEKLPALDTFIAILNALDVSADIILSGVINSGYKVKISLLSDEISQLPEEEKERIFDVVNTLIKHAKKAK